MNIELRHGRENVRRLPDRFGTGYGYEYSTGDTLYLVSLADCAFPSVYCVRADSWTEAYESAEECLLDTLTDDEIAEYGADELVSYSPSGRPVYSDSDIRVWTWRGAKSRKAVKAGAHR